MLAALITDGAPKRVHQLAGQRPAKKLAALSLPVLVDLESGYGFTYAGPLTWGSTYRDFLGTQQRLVLGDVAGPTLRPDGSARRAMAWVLAGGLLGGLLGVAVVVAVILW